MGESIGENASSQDAPAIHPKRSNSLDSNEGDAKRFLTATPPLSSGSSGSSNSNSNTSSSSHKFREMSNLSKYKVIQKLGQGTFGVVQKAKNVETNKLVALKQLLNHSAKEGFPITAMREITILKQLHHKNILELVDMVYESPKISNPLDVIHQRGCFYTVSPYMCSDLVGLLKNPNVHLEVPHIKCFMQQLLRGIQYIHKQKFLHRDIKAANILVDFDGILKIADFGLARVYHGKVPKLGSGPGGGERMYTGLVVTRWYRPPELLLGEKKYTTAVDLWGIGCVFGELFTHQPILVGKSDSHQAQLVFELVGAPTTIAWPEAINLPNKSDFSIGITCKRSLESRFSKLMTPDGISLLSGLLELDPYKRINALDALDHEYFRNEPLPMKPGELPKFEESHEIDSERFKMMKQAPSHSNMARPSASAPFPQRNQAPPHSNQRESYASRYDGGSRDLYVPGSKSREYGQHSQIQGTKRPYSSSFEERPKFVPLQPRGMFMSRRQRPDQKRRRHEGGNDEKR